MPESITLELEVYEDPLDIAGAYRSLVVSNMRVLKVAFDLVCSRLDPPVWSFRLRPANEEEGEEVTLGLLIGRGVRDSSSGNKSRIGGSVVPRPLFEPSFLPAGLDIGVILHFSGRVLWYGDRRHSTKCSRYLLHLLAR